MKRYMFLFLTTNIVFAGGSSSKDKNKRVKDVYYSACPTDSSLPTPSSISNPSFELSEVFQEKALQNKTLLEAEQNENIEEFKILLKKANKEEKKQAWIYAVTKTKLSFLMALEGSGFKKYWPSFLNNYKNDLLIKKSEFLIESGARDFFKEVYWELDYKSKKQLIELIVKRKQLQSSGILEVYFNISREERSFIREQTILKDDLESYILIFKKYPKYDSDKDHYEEINYDPYKFFPKNNFAKAIKNKSYKIADYILKNRQFDLDRYLDSMLKDLMPEDIELILKYRPDLEQYFKDNGKNVEQSDIS